MIAKEALGPFGIQILDTSGQRTLHKVENHSPGYSKQNLQSRWRVTFHQDQTFISRLVIFDPNQHYCRDGLMK